MIDTALHVIAFDSHYPAYHRPSWRALLDFTAKNKVDGFTFGGDQLDLNEISHHTKGKPIHRTRGALKRNLDGFDKYILTPVEKTLKPGCEKTWITGNHERFLQDLLDEQPELEGMLDIPGYLRLAERGWKVIELGGHHKIGRLGIIHGETLKGGAANVAKKAVEIWCSNVAFGHHHTAQSYTKAAPAHTGRKWSGTAVPCMGTTNPSYARGSANTHINGFAIAEVRPSRDFNLYTVVITDGKFSFGGNVYGVS